MSEALVVQHCSPTLAGIKTGNLFSCACTSPEEVRSSVRKINRKLVPRGIRVLPIRFSEKRALIYVYRPQSLYRDLSVKEASVILKQAGYQNCTHSRCLNELVRRLRRKDDFPHEVGLFLSYPPEDVKGFIEHKGNCSKCTGCWKVYGDERGAKCRFQAYKRCKNQLWQQWTHGVSLEELAEKL